MKYGPRPGFIEVNHACQRNHGASYWWVRGGDYNRPVIVAAFAGVISAPMPFHEGGRIFWAEINFDFPGPYPKYLWESQVDQYGTLRNLEWAGPVPMPEEDEVKVIEPTNRPTSGVIKWMERVCRGGRL